MWKQVVTGLAVAAALWPAAAMAQLQDENLLTGIPEGFKVGYEASQDGQEIHEFVPSAESVEDWTSMVTIQIYHNVGVVDGDQFAANMAQNWEGACPGSTIHKIIDGDINAFPFVLWTYACPKNPETGKPETMWLKGITGADAFYVIQYAYRQPPSDDIETVALTFLVNVSACDTRKPERPCPAGM